MKTFFPALVLVLLMLSPSYGRPAYPLFKDGDPELLPYETHFISDPEPVDFKLEDNVNPLDYAAGRIGLNLDNFMLPRAEENFYRLACRFPIIEDVAYNPLYMKHWTEQTSSEILEKHSNLGIGSIKYLLKTLRGKPSNPDISFEEIEISIGDFNNALDETGAFTPGYCEILHGLYESILVAQHLVGIAREDLTERELEFFMGNPGYYITPDGKTMTSLTGNVDSHFKFIKIARKVKYEYVFLAAEKLSDAVIDYVDATQGFTVNDFYLDGGDPESSFLIDCALSIGGFGDDTLSTNVPVVIDLGGNDRYAGLIGSSFASDMGIGICIDHSGDDEYQETDVSFTQGFGFLGVGYLVDLGGNDTYTADHFSQGAGIMGVGVLWDKAGDDDYIANAFCQGAGMFGLGALLEDSGEDYYDGATLCQGGATTLGIGVLSDLSGDDRYHLNIGPGKDTLGNLAGYGQGGALSFRHMPWRGKLTAYGGVGMLVDRNGNDRYRSSGWCDQGGSYIMSLGVLVDESGNDHYTAGSGQGSGIHITNAIHIDKDGHDIYEGGFRSGGSGGDRSPCFLIDYKGNDTYISRGANFAAACKPLALALMIDYEGEDTYISPNPEGPVTMNNWDSFGGVWPESVSYLWPYAICLDLGGNDDYQVRNRRNNSERHSFGHGIHIDTECKWKEVFWPDRSPYIVTWHTVLTDPGDTPEWDDINLLRSEDTFIRFQAIGRIITSGTDILPMLSEAVIHDYYPRYNRDILGCIHYMLIDGKITSDDTDTLIAIMRKSDDETRAILVHDFGIWKIVETESALIQAVETDHDRQVRRFALWSLMELESKDGLAAARKLAIDDPSPDVRRAAMQYLSKVRDSYDPFPIIHQAYTYDKDPTVRIAAIEAIAELADDRGLEILRDAANSYDAYLQRAAGRGLANLGHIEGIEILIESLSFPSIDAFNNYDRNIPNDIAAYCGYDLPEEDRYDQEKWQEWFEENNAAIDITANAVAYDEFREIVARQYDVPKETLIAELESFMVRYPDHYRAPKFLAATLNSVAWNMVAVAPDIPSYNPEQGLKYALRAVELVEEINYIDTLAEAYFACGQLEIAEDICIEMLEKHPGNKLFLDRLVRIQETRGE